MDHILSQNDNISKGIKKLGDKGLNGALEGVKKLHGRRCFITIYVNKLTSQERKLGME